MADESSSYSWLSLMFWRVWKWIFRLFTCRCELQRICANDKTTLPDRTCRIAASLRNSKNITFRTLASVRGSQQYRPEEAVAIVIRAKSISKQKDPRFSSRLEPAMYQIISLNSVKAEIQRLVNEKYSKTNKEHEKSLMKLWDLFLPRTPLQSRITKQWGDIGFQGDDPATDFRGMGSLGLYCLLYFAEQCNDKARKVLGNSQHPVKGYPLAISGINMTSVVVNWLNTGLLDYYYYVLTQERDGVTIQDFYETYSYVMYSFNEYWLASDVENVMDYPRIKERFAKELEGTLARRPLTIRLTLTD